MEYCPNSTEVVQGEALHYIKSEVFINLSVLLFGYNAFFKYLSIHA